MTYSVLPLKSGAKRDGVILPVEVLDLPEEQDQFVGAVKLEAMGFKIDALTPEQIAYMNDYNAGT